MPLQSEKDEFWFPSFTASQQVALEAPFFHSVEQEERYLKNAKKKTPKEQKDYLETEKLNHSYSGGVHTITCIKQKIHDNTVW